MTEIPTPSKNIGQLLQVRMDDPKTMIALGIAIFGAGIVIGSKLAAGTNYEPHRCQECDEAAEEIISHVASASAAKVYADHSGEVDLEGSVQPTPLPPVVELEDEI